LVNIYTLFGSKESEWMESMEDGKFIEKHVSTVWLLHQGGKKVYFWWVPCLKTFPPQVKRKLVT
jgi:hypothetical protein